MQDPFIEYFDHRPNTTTHTPNRDIDYILTYGLPPVKVTTLEYDLPTKSDHIGICLNIPVEVLFCGKYSGLEQWPTRQLTLQNIKAKQRDIKYIQKEFNAQKLMEMTFDL